MNKLELAQLLTLVSAFDNRTVGPDTVEAWFPIMENVSVTEAADAVREHFATTDKYLMPANIIKLVRSRSKALLPSDISFYCKQHGWPVNECPRCEEEA